MIRRAGGRIDVIGQVQSGPPLGVVEDHAYETITTKIGSGDVVVLYTDGVNEAMSPVGEQFGKGRLDRSLAAAPLGASQSDRRFETPLGHTQSVGISPMTLLSSASAEHEPDPARRRPDPHLAFRSR